MIRTWDNGVVPIGPQATSGLVEVQNDGNLNRIFMAGEDRAEILDDLRTYIDEFEDKGYLEATKFIARGRFSKQRLAISEAVYSNHQDCALTSLCPADERR